MSLLQRGSSYSPVALETPLPSALLPVPGHSNNQGQWANMVSMPHTPSQPASLKDSQPAYTLPEAIERKFPIVWDKHVKGSESLNKSDFPKEAKNPRTVTQKGKERTRKIKELGGACTSCKQKKKGVSNT